ncbi:MAG: MBL fold metallo-hydrolase [Ruminococcus sp.]|nr:MBL fold metallo-hydrolase [Ruminococcus sp.]
MTKYIDFSSKHDILIANGDGTYSRMDEPYFRSELIAPNTWKVLSSGDYSYLVVGDGVGISIDCGYGAGNIREYLESLCGVPVPYVTNTHDHFDHSANNAYFDMAFLNEKAKEFGAIPYASFAGIDFPRDYPVTIIHDGDFIPLKGRELQAFSIPDHAPSSMMYLDRKERIFFSGDEIMPMGKSLNGGLKSWIENLEKIDKYRDEFDVLYGGGGRLEKKLFDASLNAPVTLGITRENSSRLRLRESQDLLMKTRKDSVAPSTIAECPTPETAQTILMSRRHSGKTSAGLSMLGRALCTI